MHSVSITWGLTIVPIILSNISILCDAFVCSRAVKYKRKLQDSKKDQPNDEVILMLIALLTTFDIGRCFVWMFEFIPLLVHFHYSDLLCVIIGFSNQFFQTMDPLWHCLIAYTLFILLMHGTIKRFLNSNTKRIITSSPANIINEKSTSTDDKKEFEKPINSILNRDNDRKNLTPSAKRDLGNSLQSSVTIDSRDDNDKWCCGCIPHNYKHRYLFYVFIFALLCSLLPLLGNVKKIAVGYGGFYNYYSSNNGHKARYSYECWLRKNCWRLIWIGLCFAALIFHLIVLTIACCKRGNINNNFFIKRLLAWILMFVISRIPVSIIRCIEITQTLPLGVVILHHVLESLSGVTHLIAWWLNRYVDKQIEERRSALME